MRSAARRDELALFPFLPSPLSSFLFLLYFSAFISPDSGHHHVLLVFKACEIPISNNHTLSFLVIPLRCSNLLFPSRVSVLFVPHLLTHLSAVIFFFCCACVCDSQVKFLAAEALRGVGGLLLTNKGQRFVNELGTRDYVTGEMWKAKAGPYRLVLNGKGSNEILWHWSVTNAGPHAQPGSRCCSSLLC